MVILPSWAVDKSYYSSLDGKSTTTATTLVSALTTLTHGNYVGVKYGSGTNDNPSVWYTYGTSDVYPSGSPYAGKIWEIYAGCTNFDWQTNQGSSCSYVCGTKSDGDGCGYNREHALPKSWFGIKSADLTTSYRGPGVNVHHIFPTDVNVNTKRSNNPYGVVGSPEYTSPNGSKKGACTWPSGYTGTAFEPADEFKGDLARAYLYMLITWNAYNTSTYSFTQDSDGNGAVIFNDNITSAGHFGLTDFGLQLLLTWHRNDPVSQKEITRNNAIAAVQGNRNPFVDYPCLVEYIWGNKAGTVFNRSDVMGSFESAFIVDNTDGCTCSTDPVITSPSSLIDCGLTAPGTPITKTFTLRGAYLTSGNLTLSISGTNASLFSLSTYSVSKANAEAGYTVTITYSPSAAGTHSATLNISGCGVSSHTVSITGNCAIYYTATWMADGSAYHSNTTITGSRPSVPEAPDDCSASRVFVGWTTQNSYVHSTTAPADLFTTTAPVMNSDMTFYAVYADEATAGTGSATFSASDISATPSSGTLEWTHTASGIVLKLSSGQRYTSNTPNTFSVNSGDDNYARLTSPYKMTKVVATVTGNNYAINSVSGGWSKSGTTTQTITSSGLRTLTMYAPASYQIRMTQLVITYTITNYSNYSVSCSAIVPANVTATFMNGGTTYATRSGLGGSTISGVANPTPCDGYTFVGWSTNQYAANNTSAPTIDYTGTFPYSNVTYYAVYSQPTGTTPELTNDYAKITTTSELTSGNYLVVGYYNSGYFAMSTTWKNTYYLAPTTVTPVSDVISSPAASIIWAISVNGSQITLQNDSAGYLYIENSGSYYNIKLGNNTTNNKFTYSVDDGAWTLTSVTYNTRQLEYYASPARWAFYTSQDAPVYLYKQQETPNTYYTTTTNCQCTVTAVSEDDAKGTAAVSK